MTALLEATDTWAYNIDRGKINAVVFLDLKKAFDTMDHEIKLNLHGMVSVISRGPRKRLQWEKKIVVPCLAVIMIAFLPRTIQ